MHQPGVIELKSHTVSTLAEALPEAWLASCPSMLKPAIRFIVAHIPVSFIFLACRGHSGAHLLVVCSPENVRPVAAFEQLVSFALISGGDVTFTLHAYADMVERLKRGDLYHVTHCRVANLIYATTKLSLPVMAGNFAHGLARALKCFEHAAERAVQFLENGRSLLAKRSYRLAAFSFHQACEQALRGLYQSTRGNSIRTHSIAVLLKQTAAWCPGVRHVLGPDAVASERLSLLDRCYTDARYNDDFTIKEPELQMLFECTVSLIVRSCEVMNGFADTGAEIQAFET